MEEKQITEDRKPEASPGAEGAARRRRRGGRRHNKNKAAALPAAEPKAEAQAEASRPRAAQNTVALRDTTKAQAARPARRNARKADVVRPEERAEEIDNSIQLLSRRPPAQKYASFEEYMKAHGERLADDE